MSSTEKSGMGAVFAALIANVVVAASKFFGFFVSGSAAMLNEAVHSLVDCANQVLLIFGDRRAQKGSSELHPFGEARAKYFFSTIVATMLFFGGGVFGVIEASRKIGHPDHDVGNPWLVIGILVFGGIVEAFSLRVAFQEIKMLNTDKLPLFKFLHESRHSEILIIFTEDICAVIGLVLAFLGMVLTILTQNPLFDALSGLLIGILLMGAAFVMAREFYSLMIGESVTAKDLEAIRQAFAREEVERLLDIKTVHIGPMEILIAAKIDIPHAREHEATAIINAIEADIRNRLFDKKCYIYVEVDEFDPDYGR